MFNVNVITAFSDMFPGPLGYSVLGNALKNKLFNINVVNVRDFTENNSKKKIDNCPYGGGRGMILKPDVLASAIDSINCANIFNLSPRGVMFSQQIAYDLLGLQNIVLICSRFEGIDQRVLNYYNVKDISMGDYIMSGAEIGAMAIIDCCARLIRGVLAEEVVENESFNNNLLEHDHYTRPYCWRENNVPDVLKSGNHSLIGQWRLKNAEDITKKRRADLWEKYQNKKYKG